MCNDNGKSGTVLDIDTDKYGCTVRLMILKEHGLNATQLSKE